MPPVQVLIPVVWAVLESPPLGKRRDVGASAFMSNKASQGWFVCFSETLERSSKADSNPLQRLVKRTRRQIRSTHEVFIYFLKLLGFSSQSHDSLGLRLTKTECLGLAACDFLLLSQSCWGRELLMGMPHAPPKPLVSLLHPSDACSGSVL